MLSGMAPYYVFEALLCFGFLGFNILFIYSIIVWIERCINACNKTSVTRSSPVQPLSRLSSPRQSFRVMRSPLTNAQLLHAPRRT